MDVRDLKLAIACENESDEVKSLNKFFNDLFNDLEVYTDGDKPDLIFMKDDKFIMKQDLKNRFLHCRCQGFLEVLYGEYHCEYAEMQEIIQYKVEEAFKMGSLTPVYGVNELIEEAFKSGSLNPTTI